MIVFYAKEALVKTKIIAMWSGPRNLSTAMMRSFGARADCHVVDEPFYAAYLAATGLTHPMRDAVIKAGETDAHVVADQCVAFVEQPIVYQKHMAHHMIDGFPVKWMDQVTNVFLLRDPARVLASYAVKTEAVSAADIGFHQQRAFFDRAMEKGARAPVVVEASDIRANPRVMLRALCDAVGIPFDEAMLKWEKGPKPEDGVWAAHWYDAVWRSTGFAPPETKPVPDLPPHLAAIEAQVRGDYEHMRAFRLKV